MTKILLINVVFTLFVSTLVCANTSIDVESGYAVSQINDVQVPNPGGTRLSLTDDLKTGSKPFFRLNVLYKYSEKHDFSILYAPLNFTAKGSINRDIYFNGDLFTANIPLSVGYKFNSYRFTYRYKFLNSSKEIFAVGVTGKVRDAYIEFKNNVKTSKTSNLGFVPLLHLFYKRAGRFGYRVLEGGADVEKVYNFALVHYFLVGLTIDL
jgi:hypothetical protein